ncbi:MAG: hypothetical protein K9I82_01440 [Chitinophagaceae bacterium]|nr:hypothetical protein [Chitinophagaceae bacterium]
MELRSFIKRTIREYLSEERFLSENVLDSKINKVTETEEFKKWFDGSKVVDDNQNPLVVYHGASSTFKDFKSSFDGIWFSDNINVAETITGIIGLKKPKYSKRVKEILNGDYKNINDLLGELIKVGFRVERRREEDVYGNKKSYIYIIDKNGYEHKLSDYIRPMDVKTEIIKRGTNYAVFLKIINPLIVNAKNSEWDNIIFNGEKSSTADISIFAKEHGFDGVIFNNLYEFGIKSNVYIVYDNNQIKKINL